MNYAIIKAALSDCYKAKGSLDEASPAFQLIDNAIQKLEQIEEKEESSTYQRNP